jgi:hypothetical protein
MNFQYMFFSKINYFVVLNLNVCDDTSEMVLSSKFSSGWKGLFILAEKTIASHFEGFIVTNAIFVTNLKFFLDHYSK